ncbi:hypothetical protein [Pseudomonas abietaniphila]|jgi:hypothetical protein|uniref:Apea-like HEPN domain-containing protein n=1 Tax=Pseudomonas abietaniphila TaxID=89065 RepID=A0A1G8R2V7_9PSED|nr:hypothetical protein [Pseudomonas abietaniphila]SDJ11297.1 hypothetical protein SAMN05216605_121147 [Pseudomonas abietaniphila]
MPQRDIEPLDLLAFEFFREFARCEYCLKISGFLTGSPRAPKANWTTFAQSIEQLFNEPGEQLADAIGYYLEHPPKKQIVGEEGLTWEQELPNHANVADLVLKLVCRVRNNLFHGGKFNGHWFEPQRSDDLLRAGLIILRSAISASPQVSQAYAGRAE